MSYSLGVDLGAATCTAAVAGRDGAPEPCALGDGTATMPSAALVLADGTVVVGEEADSRSPYEPPLVARIVTGRLGEAEPITVDGVRCDPLALTEALLRTVVERCVGRSGEMPAQLVVTFPLRAAAAEPLLHEAARRITGAPPVLVPEPIAAVAKLAGERDLGDDTTIAVVDVGASSVDVALVRRTPTALDLIGEPASRTDIAGTDLDAAVLALVEGAVGDVTSTVRPGDHAAMRDLRRLRASCRRAKESLSTVDGAVVALALPATRGQVEITRAAFEAAAAPALHAAVDLVLATIDGAGVDRADVGLVLVTGGSARIPLLSRLLTDRTGMTVVSDDRPDLTVSLGATLFAHLTAERPAPPWHEAGTGWDDSRTSVFDPPPPPSPPPPTPPPSPTAAGPSAADDDLDHDQFRRLTTSATDPFGTRSGTYLARGYDRDDEYVDDDGRPTDLRLILGGVVAAAAVLVLGAFTLLAGAGSDSGNRLAVADTVATTASTSPPASTSTTVASTSTTAEPTTTTTTEEPTTPTRPRSGSTTPTTTAPAPSPPTAPPTSGTTQPPPTTTTESPTSTSTPTPTCPPQAPGCNGK